MINLNKHKKRDTKLLRWFINALPMLMVYAAVAIMISSMIYAMVPGISMAAETRAISNSIKTAPEEWGAVPVNDDDIDVLHAKTGILIKVRGSTGIITDVYVVDSDGLPQTQIKLSHKDRKYLHRLAHQRFDTNLITTEKLEKQKIDAAIAAL